MTLAFDSPAALFHKHPTGGILNGKQVYSTFANLIERPTKFQKGYSAPGSFPSNGTEKDHQVYNQGYFRIRAEIFYDELTDDKFELAGLNHLNDSERQALKASIKSCNMSFYLNLLKHEFRWDFPDGNSDQSKTYFELKIDYVGAVESGMQDTSSNILTPVDSAKLKQFQETEIYKQYHDLLDTMNYQGMTNLINPAAAANVKTSVRSLTPESYAKMVKQRGNIRARRKTSLDPDIQKSEFEGDLGSDLQEEIKEQSKSWAKLNVAWSAENSILAAKFHEIKIKYDAAATQAGVSEAQQLNNAYNAIYDKLWGNATDSARSSARYADAKNNTDAKIAAQRAGVNHVWEFEVDVLKFNDYLTRSETRGLSDYQRKALQEAAKNKDTAAIQRLKNRREGQQANIRNFYANFWKKNVKERIFTARRDIRQREAGNDVEGIGWNADDTSATSTTDERRRATEQAAVAQARGDSETANQWINHLTPSQKAPALIKGKVHLIQFFFLGDLLDIAIELAFKHSSKNKLDFFSHNKNKNGKLHFILGDVRYNDFLSSGMEKINLDAIPISTKLFDEFWVKHVIKRQRKNYPLKQFLRDVLVDLIQAAFTNKNRTPGEPTNKITCGIDYVSVDPINQGIIVDFRKARSGRSSRSAPKQYFGNRISIAKNTEINRSAIDIDEIQNKDRSAPLKAEEPEYSFKGTKELCILYSYSNKPTYFKGNMKADQEKGIPHINIGIAPTSITRVDFKKTDQPMYLEAKGEVDGIKDNSLELSEPYSVGLTMPGNFIFRPGSHFRLTMEGFGSPQTRKESRGASYFGAEKTVLAASPARRLGLGGYFMVNKCSHTLSARMGDYQTGYEWTTELDALWVTFGGIAEKRSTPASDTAKLSNTTLDQIRKELNANGVNPDTSLLNKEAAEEAKVAAEEYREKVARGQARHRLDAKGALRDIQNDPVITEITTLPEEE